MAAIDTITAQIRRVFPNLNISATSIWYNMLIPVAVAIDALELENKRTTILMGRMLAEQKYTTERDYVQKLVQWQEGDYYGYIDEARYIKGYQTINPSKQNCKQAFINKDTQTIYVSSVDANGMLVKMTDVQLQEISSYFENFRVVGFQYGIATSDPAILNATKLTVRFSKEQSLETVRLAVQARIKEFQVTPHFTSEVLVNTIESFIRETDGVFDAYLTNPSISHDGTTYQFVSGAVTVPTTAINFWDDIFTDNPTTLELIPV